jgi:hypothetical protein
MNVVICKTEKHQFRDTSTESQYYEQEYNNICFGGII